MENEEIKYDNEIEIKKDEEIEIKKDEEIEIKKDNRKNVRTVNSTSNKKKQKQNNHTSIILIVSILLSFVCGMIGAYIIVQEVSVSSVVKNITTSELVETSIATSVDKVYGSTVVVIASANGAQISTGTGFIYKIDGKKAYIMTNNHVIDGADSVQVEFNNSNEKIDAKIVGGEVYSDIAVLTITATNEMTAVEIGDSTKASLGDTIFTVGSPMGIDYKGTVTKGIVSGKDRLVAVNLTGNASDYYMKVLQIDAAVNPGNSGGPLCDVSGKVIGLISLKIVQNEVEGMGFAIPIEDALKYATTIEEGGVITRPYIGISMLDLTSEYYLQRYMITVPDNIDEGIAIVEVVASSPADKAGLKKGDIITEIGGKSTGTLAEFRYELYQHEVGEDVSIKYYRDGKLKETMVTLGKSD